MLPFLHQRLQALERLQAACSAVLVKFNAMDLDLPAALASYLDDAIAACKQLNQAGWENQFLGWKAQTVSAAQGTHPDTLEPTTGHRRAMQRAVALRVLQHSAGLLRTEIDRAQQSLADATAQLRPMLLMTIGQKLVALPQRNTIGQAQVEKVWKTFLNTPEIQLAARQVAMQVSVPDLHLLLGGLMQAARAAARPVD